MTRPADVLQQMLRSDSAKPRITTYDDTDGPTRGERIELSARVLGNWVNKAANALQDEFDIAPGSVVRLDLPPHWRTAYWALATWSVGGTVTVETEDTEGTFTADLLVTTDPQAAVTSSSPAVLVTLAGLARSAGAAVPDGVMDEAKELSTHGDQFAAWEEPDDSATALIVRDERTAYADLVVPQQKSAERRHLITTDTGDFLRACLALWAADGSVVLSRGEAPADVLTERSRVEGATST